MLSFFKTLFSKPEKPSVFPPEWAKILDSDVAFYRALSDVEKLEFQRRVLLFLQTTRIEAGQFEPSDQDKLLVAASAIIPVWRFPKWHYFNLDAVFLLPGAFNADIELGRPDSLITGMVGTGVLEGKMVLSQPHLIQGFKNDRDKKNVGIHEFVHLVDMADGEGDGFPERLKEFSYSIPWFEFVDKKIAAILKRKSNINPYAATNRQEFFAVASEYFFERPKMLKKKHPQLYEALSEYYQQDIANIEKDIAVRKKDPCPCGSGKRYKHCCMPKD